MILKVDPHESVEINRKVDVQTQEEEQRMRKAENGDKETWGGGVRLQNEDYIWAPEARLLAQWRVSLGLQRLPSGPGRLVVRWPQGGPGVRTACQVQTRDLHRFPLLPSRRALLRTWGGGALRVQRGPLCKAEWGDGPPTGPTCLTWATSLMSASSLSSCSSFFSWLRSVRKPSPILCRVIRETRFLHLFCPPQPQAPSSPMTPPPRKHRTPGAGQVPTTETCPQTHAPPPAPHRPETWGPVSAHPQGPHLPEPQMDGGLPAAPAQPGHPTLPPTLQHSAVSKQTPASVSLFLI